MNLNCCGRQVRFLNVMLINRTTNKFKQDNVSYKGINTNMVLRNRKFPKNQFNSRTKINVTLRNRPYEDFSEYYYHKSLSNL